MLCLFMLVGCSDEHDLTRTQAVDHLLATEVNDVRFSRSDPYFARYAALEAKADLIADVVR